MKSQDMARITIRVKNGLWDKLGYIAACDGRSKNKEMELMIKEWVRAFEDVYGEIVID